MGKCVTTNLLHHIRRSCQHVQPCYRKRTNTGRYLSFHSCHSSATKQGFIKGPFLSAEKFCSTPDLLKTVLKRIYSDLLINLYMKKCLPGWKFYNIATSDGQDVVRTIQNFTLDSRILGGTRAIKAQCFAQRGNGLSQLSANILAGKRYVFTWI